MIRDFSKKQIFAVVILLLLVIAIPIGAFYVQKTQVLKSKAAQGSVLDAFEIKDSSTPAKILNPDCDGTAKPPICPISTTEVTITIKSKPGGLDALLP